MAVSLFAVFVALCLGLYFMYRELPIQLKAHSGNNRWKYWLRTSLPMLISSGMFIIFTRSDLIFVGSIEGPQEAGIYGAVYRMSALLLFGTQAVNMIAAPLFSELYYKSDLKKLQKIVTLSTRCSFGLALILSIVFILFGKFFLGFFGDRFIAGYSALVILSLASVVRTLFGSGGYLLNMTGNQNIVALVYGITAILNIILNIILIPRLGIEGAAWATSISIVVWSGVMYVYVMKRIKINSILQ